MIVRSRSVGTVFAAAIYFVALALGQAKLVNVDPSRYDQQTYLDQARWLADTSFHGVTNRVQMPLVPCVLALFHSPGLDAASWFWRAKLVMIGISVVASLAVALAVRRTFEERTARLIALICVFYIFIFRATYVQAEVPYYALAILSLLALVSFVRAPAFWRAAIAGALAGAAWLAKASFLLVLFSFVATFVVRELFWGERRSLAKHLAATASVIASFAAVIYPYARTSRELGGGYLYNASSTYVIYCDTWEECRDRIATMGPPETWWKLADKSNVPSLSHFLATHSVAQIAVREIEGLALALGNFLLTPCAPFLIGLGVVAIVVLRRNRDLRAHLFRRDPRAPWAPVLAALVIPTLALGFYGVLAANARFSLGIAAPAIVVLAGAMSARPDALWSRAERIATRLALAGLVLVVPVLMLTVYFGG